jgi:hypothetical protein
MNEHPFISPIKSGFNTAHGRFYDFMSESALNEFMKRARSNNNKSILRDHILNALFNNNIYDIDILTNVHINKLNNVSIYIYFKRHNKPYAHISFHITGRNFKSKEDGMIHLKNERTHKRNALNINVPKLSNNEGNIYQILLKFPVVMTITDIYPEYQIAIDVLNRYFTRNQEEPLSLIYDLSTKRYNHSSREFKLVCDTLSKVKKTPHKTRKSEEYFSAKRSASTSKGKKTRHRR